MVSPLDDMHLLPYRLMGAQISRSERLGEFAPSAAADRKGFLLTYISTPFLRLITNSIHAVRAVI